MAVNPSPEQMARDVIAKMFAEKDGYGTVIGRDQAMAAAILALLAAHDPPLCIAAPPDRERDALLAACKDALQGFQAIERNRDILIKLLDGAGMPWGWLDGIRLKQQRIESAIANAEKP